MDCKYCIIIIVVVVVLSKLYQLGISTGAVQSTIICVFAFIQVVQAHVISYTIIGEKRL